MTSEHITSLRNAAELRLRLEAWQEDQGFRKDGGEIFYAVDSDIVSLYFNPFSKARYARVFHDDEQETDEILAWTLGRFIFSQLTVDPPLFVIPPHDLEMQRIFLAIEKNVSTRDEHFSTVGLSAAENFMKIYGENNDEKALIQGLIAEAPNVIRYLNHADQSSTAELKRVSELMASRRLLHIEHYKSNDDWVFPIPDETKFEDYDDLRKLHIGWFVRLRSEAGKQKKIGSISNDAEVLARLEWINQRLTKENKRLVLISGDQAMQRAANLYKINGTSTFANKYICDPRIFLADPRFFLEPENSSKSGQTMHPKAGTIKWLDVLLDYFNPGGQGYSKRLRAFLSKDEKNGSQKRLVSPYITDMDKEALDKRREVWRDYVSLVANHHGLPELERMANETVKKLIKSHDIYHLLEKHIAETLIDFSGAITQSAFWSWLELRETKGILEHGALPASCVPPLRFVSSTERFEVAERYAHRIVASVSDEELTGNPASTEELLEEDPSHYTQYVVYGLAFAAAGRWHTTHFLAERALNIADRSITAERKRTGHEAAYLLAVAIRHDAKTQQKLSEAKKYLGEAEKRWNEAYGDGKIDIRFTVEKITLDIAHHHYRLFKKGSVTTDIFSLLECQSGLLDILSGSALEKEDDGFRTAMERRICTNLFMVLFLREYKEQVENPAEEIDMLSLLNRFKRVVKTPTYIDQVVYWLACWRYGKESERKQYIEEIKKNVPPMGEKKKTYNFLPYDEPRYQFYLDFVKADNNL